jgi:hypothetical protein
MEEVQGVNIQETNIKSMLVGSKLDWRVRTEGLQTDSGIIVPKSVAVIREDTNKVLSLRGEGYHTYQNEELMELLYRVSEKSGLQIHRGGFFGEGEKVYIQLKSGEQKIGTDKVKGYLTGINSFDGSTSLAFGPSSITISCMNTFFGAFREMKTKVRHTKNMVLRVEDIVRKLEVAMVDEKEMFNNIVKLSETPIGVGDLDKAIREQVTRNLFKIEKSIPLNDVNQISTRTRNQMTRFEIDLMGELKEKGQNLWGLFSGVTKFTTHSMGENRKTFDSDEKMYNDYGRREQKIFNDLVAMV